MTLQPVNHLLQKLMDQRAWAHQKRFQQISQHWQQILPAKSLANSRPSHLTDDILWVATANTTWAQHLNLQRTRLLAQLNAQLHPPLTDIRFSSAHWHRTPAYSPLADPDLPHPSRLPADQRNIDPVDITPTAATSSPQAAIATVETWLRRQQARFAELPPCPQCHAPAPPGEIERWQMCACCIAQVWQSEQYSAAPFPTPIVNDHGDLSPD